MSCSSLRTSRSQHFHAQPHTGYGPLALNMVRHGAIATSSTNAAAGSAMRATGAAARFPACAGGPTRPMGRSSAVSVKTAAAQQEQQDTVALRDQDTDIVVEGLNDIPAAPATGIPLPLPSTRTYTAAEVFQCAEESLFYSQTLEKMLPTVQLRHAQRVAAAGAAAPPASPSAPSSAATAAAASTGADGGEGPRDPSRLIVAEFGTGDGTPVVSALLKTRFSGVIHGFELNPTSAALAREHAERAGLADTYQIHTGCFYAGTSAPGSPAAGADCLVSNPPYLPAPDSDILMPELFGGKDGVELTRDLLTQDFPYAVLLVSSYSHPASVLAHAAACGYRVVDFLVTPLPFGTYSSQPKVRDWIADMKTRKEAFYAGNTYVLAGVLFEKRDLPKVASLRGNSSPSPSSNGHSANGNGHSGNGNGNGNGYRGGKSVTIYHRTEAEGEEEVDPDDIAPQLLRLLTAL